MFSSLRPRSLKVLHKEKCGTGVEQNDPQPDPLPLDKATLSLHKMLVKFFRSYSYSYSYSQIRSKIKVKIRKGVRGSSAMIPELSFALRRRTELLTSAPAANAPQR